MSIPEYEELAVYVKSRGAFTRFYMGVWQLFFLEYLLVAVCVVA